MIRWYPDADVAMEGQSRWRPGLEVICACGHRRPPHRHYRPGAECVLCLPGWCRRYRPRLRVRRGITRPPLALPVS